MTKLESVADLYPFLDCMAEYVIASRLVHGGCQIEVEVPTKNRKHADLRVTRSGDCLYIHIKRLNHDRDEIWRERVEARFEVLNKINRPHYIEIRPNPDLTEQQIETAIQAAKSFILDPSGTEQELISDGIPLARARILGPSGENHAAVWVNFGMTECKDRVRVRDKLEDAREQFMPGEINITFLAWFWTTDDDLLDLENALLGSTCGEAVPDENGELKSVPTGRLGDGFWSRGRHPDSHAVASFSFLLSTGVIDRCKLWTRPGSADKIPLWFQHAF